MKSSTPSPTSITSIAPCLDESLTHLPQLQSEREMDEHGGRDGREVESPTHSQKTVSDDDEIDYTVKPKFYDSDLDEKDELWIHKKRQGRSSDAVLSCPACFTTLCLECQRHESYVTQYRAVFVVNCKIENDIIMQQRSSRKKKGKRDLKGSDERGKEITSGEILKQVCCSVCLTKVGVIDEDEVYHFLDVLPSET